ncbi:hypothetical protein ACNQFN_09340 [Thauera butanivorans]|uniref:hypothetical protein n=1 Tax=Thauera butanivorans TaxID=86174 RepID=UPI003AB506CB
MMSTETHPAVLLKVVLAALEDTYVDLDEQIAVLKSVRTAAFLDRRTARTDSLDRLLDAAVAWRQQYALMALATAELIDHLNATPIWSSSNPPEGT